MNGPCTHLPHPWKAAHYLRLLGNEACWPRCMEVGVGRGAAVAGGDRRCICGGRGLLCFCNSWVSEWKELMALRWPGQPLHSRSSVARASGLKVTIRICITP